MVVYVDNMFKYAMGNFRGMKMSHMIADTDAELHAMAKRVGLKRKWFQGDHYDLSMSLRKLAIAAGAVPITLRQCAIMAANKRAGYPMGTPQTCVKISQRRVEAERAMKELI